MLLAFCCLLEPTARNPISRPMHNAPISGPGGRSTATASIIPPPQSKRPVPALLHINSFRLRLRSR